MLGPRTHHAKHKTQHYLSHEVVLSGPTTSRPQPARAARVGHQHMQAEPGTGPGSELVELESDGEDTGRDGLPDERCCSCSTTQSFCYHPGPRSALLPALVPHHISGTS